MFENYESGKNIAYYEIANSQRRVSSPTNK